MMITFTANEAIKLGLSKTELDRDDVIDLLTQLKNIKKERDKFSASLSTVKNQTNRAHLNRIKKLFDKDPFIKQELDRFLLAIKLKLSEDEINDLNKYLGLQ